MTVVLHNIRTTKNLTNLIFHQEDFHVQAEWIFFATSHGKNACDGVGGTTKRLAAHASLQLPFSDPILTPKQPFDFAMANVDGITIFFVSSEEVASHTEFLEARFSTSATFKETQSQHQFIPNNSSKTLTMKTTSLADYSKEISLADGRSSRVQMMIDDIKPGKFYVCRHDEDWYFCTANYVSSEHGVVNIKFLDPKGPAAKLFSPQHDDICWIPIEDLYCEVDTPSTGSTGGQFYCFNKTIANIESYFK